MDKLSDLWKVIQADTIDVPVWEVLSVLVIAMICILTRGPKMGLLITYIFALHMAVHFFKQNFSTLALLLLGLAGAIILIMGLFEALTER